MDKPLCLGFAPLIAAALLSACTWVPMRPGAQAVRVFAEGPQPAGCTQVGEVEVDVLHALATIERNPLRVREELETLARNEAVGLAADAVQPIAPPTGGTQRFRALRCRPG